MSREALLPGGAATRQYLPGGPPPQRGPGRPKGSTKDPDIEIVKELNAWLGRLKRSGALIDKLLDTFQRDLEAPDLTYETRSDIMGTLKDSVAVQVRVVVECQRMRAQGGVPAAAEPPVLDLR